MFQNHNQWGAVICFTLLSGIASANEAHKSLEGLSEIERMMFWTAHMEETKRDCVVTEDFFMGFDKEQAAYWSVNCNNSRDNGIIVQIPNSESGKTRIMECSIADAIGVPCFKKMD